MGQKTIIIAIDDVIWREDLYPRYKSEPSRIQQYAECIELLPPIEINQHNELIDGYHRWIAHKKLGRETITALVTETRNDAELDRLMAKRNAEFGIQLSTEEKRRKARQWFQTLSDDVGQIADDLNVSKRTIHRWLSRRLKDLKAERAREIAEMWLACYTEQEIADAVGMPRQTVTDHAQELPKSDSWQKSAILSAYAEPDWAPPLYDVWKVQNKSNRVDHPGNTEARWMDNLLYMYTEPFDIVVDPFAGGGSTIDICKRRLRRYWVSDRKPIIEREREIRQWDILQGPPPLYKRWGDVKLLYLDPPYWRQSQGSYSDEPEDLANMGLEEFYDSLSRFIRQCAEKLHTGARIALIIQATQWKAPERQLVDHAIDLILRLQEAPLRYMRRIMCPYESQQCSAQMVEWAKEQRQLLVISREMLVWQKL